MLIVKINWQKLLYKFLKKILKTMVFRFLTSRFTRLKNFIKFFGSLKNRSL